MSSLSLQDLKNSVSEIRKAEWDTANFPAEKLGGGLFSVAEACALLEQIVQTIEMALRDEQRCIESVMPEEMGHTANDLSCAAQYIQAQKYEDYVLCVMRLIGYARPFAMLSMEKMDSKRYRQISDLDHSLGEIKAKMGDISKIHGKAKQAEGKISGLQDSIAENQKQSEECGNLRDQIAGLLAETQSMRDEAVAHATTRKDEIDQFSSLLQKRETSIASQEAATKDYKQKLTEFSAEAEAAEAARDTKNKEKLAEFSASCASSMKEAQKLIDNANQALRLTAAQGLAVAFKSKEDESANPWAKGLWLFLAMSATMVAIAIGLGLDLKLLELLGIGNSDNATGAYTVLRRALAVFVAISIAGFAGGQYAKNKTIEEDYAYKAALAASFPGFANELGKPEDEAMRKEYTSKLLAEILQDPQRVRKAEKKNLFSRKKESSEN